MEKEKITRRMLTAAVSSPLFAHAVFWGLFFSLAIYGSKNTVLHIPVIFVAVVSAIVWIFLLFRTQKKITSGNFQLQKTVIVSTDVRIAGAGVDEEYTKTICFANRFDTYITHDKTNLLFEGKEVLLLLINNRIKEAFRSDSYQIEYTDSYSDTCWNNDILDGKYVAVHGKENHEQGTYRSTLS